MEFSKRHGIGPEPMLQVGTMDDRLRSAIYNCLHLYILEPFERAGKGYGSEVYERCQNFFRRMWGEHLRLPLNKYSGVYDRIEKAISDVVMKGKWWEVYDLLEWVVQRSAQMLPVKVDRLIAFCNTELERENSGYRIVGDLVTPITDQTEISSIAEAQTSAQERKLLGIAEHLRTAQERLADRQNPDYRNSIKEAISAVEGLANAIAGRTDDTLGDALTAIERSGAMPLHAALKKALKQIYGYTSDSDGIRHFLIEESGVSDFADAKFMLVSCSAFINFMLLKAEKAGVSLGANRQEQT